MIWKKLHYHTANYQSNSGSRADCGHRQCSNVAIEPRVVTCLNCLKRSHNIEAKAQYDKLIALRLNKTMALVKKRLNAAYIARGERELS